MRFYLHEKLEKIRKQLRPKTCWDIKHVLALYGLICVRFVVSVVARRYVPWMARYDVLSVTADVLRINFPEEVCFFCLIIFVVLFYLLVELTDPKLTLWSYMYSIHSQHVDNYRATKVVEKDKFFNTKFQALLRNQHLLEPPNRILRWANKYLPELFDHRRLTVAAYRHQSPYLRLLTFRHRYNNMLVVHSVELFYYSFFKFFYAVIVLFIWIVINIQLRLFPLVFLPLLVVEDSLVAYIVLGLIRTCMAMLIIGYLSFIQLRVYFHHLSHLMVRQMQQATLSVAFPRVFRLFQVEYNRSVWLLMKLDQEVYHCAAFILIAIHCPILIVHANLIYLEPRMHVYLTTYLSTLSTLEVLVALVCMVDTIRTSEAAYTITNLLPNMQLKLQQQSGQLRLKLKVMRYFEAMNCPMSKRVTISIGSIDKITRYSTVQLIFSMSNLFLMIARLLIEGKHCWIYE